MSKKTKRRLFIAASVVSVCLAILIVAASILTRRFEPLIREQAIRYMSERFDSEVELKALRVRLPKTSSLRLILTKGRGILASVEGEGIAMRFRRSPDLPPLFSIRKFRFDVDLATLWDQPAHVPSVELEGVEITIPPKGERPNLSLAPAASKSQPSAIIDRVQMIDAKLALLPKDSTKVPLRFDIHSLRLDSAGMSDRMKYHAVLTNPKPKGQIDSHGTFGPWATTEPGDTPLTGKYRFENADLGVLPAVAGILRSTGDFKGALASVEAKGEATVPDFRLKMAGNPVPLTTRFQVLVDGTNGNTILQPVHAKLGETEFTTSGGIIKHEGEKRRSILLDVLMPRGQVKDLLSLAMKGSPFMEGIISLKTKIGIPPLDSELREKLLLDGSFTLSNAKFLKSNIQNQIDGLSRRGQGQPKDEAIDQVVSNMRGRFRLENEVLTFRSLGFAVPGAEVRLAGDYNLDADALAFQGDLRLKARVSETMTGWKRWVLKPVDPIFAKDGAGTVLPIKVEGSSKDPKFGLRWGGNEQSRSRTGPGT